MANNWTTIEPTEPGLYWLEVAENRCRWVDNIFVVLIDEKMRVELVANRDRIRRGTIGWVGQQNDYFVGARWCRIAMPQDPSLLRECLGNGHIQCQTAKLSLKIEPTKATWISRARVNNCILQTGDNAPPSGVVLVSENPPRMISSDDYNTRPNVPPRMM